MAVIQDQMKPRSDTLWPWYLLTAIYLSFGGVVLWDRWGEVGSLFEPPGSTPGRLPLNSIGDVLAGFFAPLAFLWLFVATQLQRKELRLQREELADTRRVLDEQKAEMQRSAEESNLQTSIMQKNLDAVRSKEFYDEFSLELYYIARNIYSSKSCTLEVSEPTIVNPETGNILWSKSECGITNFRPSIALSSSNPSSVDDFFEALYISIIYIEDITSAKKGAIIRHGWMNIEAFELLQLIHELSSEIIHGYDNDQYSLISLRLQHCKIKELGLASKVVEKRFQAEIRDDPVARGDF
ncbi:hypothetical protein [Methylobacterium sp. J-092]|uniref:hypothetical protein n=1 Tax=Methylobacterium sp. J-092 TaxID=2836667 RepID=UPI001FBC140C|nr:hypothetical protein [Methylobacterium sp. J-092]MCJ2005744.1 hypothetical protein [Methylobacterium sp. J-092]